MPRGRNKPLAEAVFGVNVSQEASMFVNMWTDRRRYWQQKAHIATIQEPRDPQHIDSLLLDLTTATARAQRRTASEHQVE